MCIINFLPCLLSFPCAAGWGTEYQSIRKFIFPEPFSGQPARRFFTGSRHSLLFTNASKDYIQQNFSF